MDPQSGDGTLETARTDTRVHVLGAGPVGLLLTALLQPMAVSASVREASEYTRSRMVRLATYLVADSVEAYGPTTSMGTTSRPSSSRRSSRRASRSGSRFPPT